MRGAKSQGGGYENPCSHSNSGSERLPKNNTYPGAYYRGAGVKMLYEYSRYLPRKNIPHYSSADSR